MELCTTIANWFLLVHGVFQGTDLLFQYLQVRLQLVDLAIDFVDQAVALLGRCREEAQVVLIRLYFTLLG